MLIMMGQSWALKKEMRFQSFHMEKAYNLYFIEAALESVV